MGLFNWIGEKTSGAYNAVSNAVEHGVNSVIDETQNLASNISEKGLLNGVGSYAYENGKEIVKGVGQLTEDALDYASNNGKGALKLMATGAGFIPVIGDAAEIVLQGAATGVGIITNPKNWKAELAEGALEVAIAAIPGPAGAVYKGAKMATKATTGLAKEAAEIGIKAATKEATQIVTKTTTRKAANVAEYALGNGVKGGVKATGKIAEQAILPGIGHFARQSLIRGWTHKGVPVAMAKDIAFNNPVVKLVTKGRKSNLTHEAMEQAGQKYTSIMGKKVPKSLAETAPDAAKSLARNIDEADNLLLRGLGKIEGGVQYLTGKYSKTNLMAQTVWDELVWENLVTEQAGQAWSRYTANALSSDGELVQTMMGDEYRQVLNDPSDVLAYHGINSSESLSNDALQFQDIQSYMRVNISKEIRDSLPDYVAAKTKMFAIMGDDYSAFTRDEKLILMQDHFKTLASKIITTHMSSGQDSEGKEVRLFAWDHDKQIPVTSENLSEYAKHLTISAEEALRISDKEQANTKTSSINESEFSSLFAYLSILSSYASHAADSASKESFYSPLEMMNQTNETELQII